MPVCHEVHAFSYPWYGTPAVDGKWLHWDHRQLPHWNAQIAAQHPTGRHVPPGDIGADFTPLGGPYSSRDPAVLARHMRQLRLAGVGTLVASWFPPGRADDNGAPLDEVWPAMLAAADDAGLTVAPHLEPYEGRTAQSVGRDVAAFLKRFGGSAALYRRSKRPVVYVYDSNRIAPEAWGEVLTRGGGSSLRGGGSDVFAVGLITTAEEVSALARSGFDAAYTYFASHGQTFAARPAHWAQLATRLRALGLELVPSVGPGYSDRAVRPWNGGATAARANGSYYDAGWRAALEADTPMVAVTSFNEWHEGTQIEPAVPAERSGAAAAAMGGGVYEDYRPMPPDGYLTRTRLWAMRFKEMRARRPAPTDEFRPSQFRPPLPMAQRPRAARSRGTRTRFGRRCCRTDDPRLLTRSISTRLLTRRRRCRRRAGRCR